MTDTLLNEAENKAADHFLWKHRCKKGAQRKVALTCSPTGIGINIKAECLGCGRAKDITDYQSW